MIARRDYSRGTIAGICWAIVFIAASLHAMGFSADNDPKPISAQVLALLNRLDKSENYLYPTPSDLAARDRVKEAISAWKDGALNSLFIGDGYGVGAQPGKSDLRKILGSPDRQTNQELRFDNAVRKSIAADTPPKGAQQLLDCNPWLVFKFKDDDRVGYALADKDKGKTTCIFLFDPKTREALSGTNTLSGDVLWYGKIGFGFLKTAFGGERLAVLMTSPHGSFPAAAKVPLGAGEMFSNAPTNWPTYSMALEGNMEVRVKNPNDFKVRVGLRSEGRGKDFTVAPNATESVRVPKGRYDIYFHYSSDPDGLYQGDSFTLKDNGVEIRIVKIVNGNYGIRKVK